MTRTMGDSTTSADIPASFDLVAGYCDGIYKWTDADWLRHADKVLVRIAVRATTNDGQVLDVEQGDATPWEAVAWVQLRRGAGADPTVYCSRNDWPDVQAAFQRANIPEPHYWIADYGDGVTPRPAPPIPAGAVALQYARDTQTGGHYDASVVADFWPGVDVATEFVTKAEFEAYKVALQAQLDATPVKPHTHDVPAKTISLLAQETGPAK